MEIQAVALLPREKQAPYAKRLASILLERQEKDGSWWDYPLYDYHQPYGTGYALMALAWPPLALVGFYLAASMLAVWDHVPPLAHALTGLGVVGALGWRIWRAS